MENNLITIKSPRRELDDHAVRTGMGTQVFLRDGTEITDIKTIDVHYAVEDILSATIELAIEQVEDIEAHPFLGLETVRAAAKRYGFDLVAKEFPGRKRRARGIRDVGEPVFEMESTQKL